MKQLSIQITIFKSKKHERRYQKDYQANTIEAQRKQTTSLIRLTTIHKTLHRKHKIKTTVSY